MASVERRTSGMGRLPDFLVIGAARSGTTTVHRWLVEHPETYVPLDKRPEPHYFLKSTVYSRGIEAYRRRYFSDVGSARAIGEVSTSYLYGADVARRIARELPQVRLIVLLRHPIERTWSSYWHTRRAGFEPLGFEEALAAEPRRLAEPISPMWDEIRPHAYLDRSRYDVQIARYLQYFDRSRLFVGLFDTLAANPAQLARQVFRFLGVDPDFSPMTLDARLNRSAPPVSRMAAATRRRLERLFAPEIERLAARLDLDLDPWRHHIRSTTD